MALHALLRRTNRSVNISSMIKTKMEKNLTRYLRENEFRRGSKEDSTKYMHRFIHTSKVAEREETIMDVFDRNAKRIQRERAAQAASVENFDYLKEEMGYRLSDRVLDIKRKMKVCVDLSSGRGYVTRHLTKHSVDKLYAIEFSPTMLQQCQMPPDNENIISKKILFDEDILTSGDIRLTKLPFDDESVDIVTSNLALHWVNNLPGLFSEVKRILRKDGVFIGSMFGGETLFELRCSLQMAELEREGGFGSHISPYVEVQDLGNLLNRTGFSMLTIDSDEIKVNFPSIFELMRDLKGMAENNASWARKCHIHKDTLMAANAIYQELYGSVSDESGRNILPATFQIYYWIGWKPDPKQPKALQPQTSDVSLKDLYKLDEVVGNIQSENVQNNNTVETTPETKSDNNNLKDR